MAQRRQARAHSLASEVLDVLEAARVPVGTATMRTVLGAVREQSVTAEQLARVAAYERERFKAGGSPPRLCEALDSAGRAVAPRRWALGRWPLRQRIMSADVRALWDIAEATYVCEITKRLGETAPRNLTELCLERIAAVLGSTRAYLPTSEEQWAGLSDQLQQLRGQWEPEAGTPQQRDAEDYLLEGEHIIPFGIYFGVGARPTWGGGSRTPVVLRLPDSDHEAGEDLHSVVARRLHNDVDATMRTLAYLQLVKQVLEGGAVPEPAEIASLTDANVAQVQSVAELFALAFPEEDGPEAVAELVRRAEDLQAQPWVGMVRVVDLKRGAAVEVTEAGPLTETERQHAEHVQQTHDFQLADQATALLHRTLEDSRSYAPSQPSPAALTWQANQLVTQQALADMRGVMALVAAGLHEQVPPLERRVITGSLAHQMLFEDVDGELASAWTTPRGSIEPQIFGQPPDSVPLAAAYERLADWTPGAAGAVFSTSAQRSSDPRRALFLCSWVAADLARALAGWSGIAAAGDKELNQAVTQQANHLSALGI